MIPLDEALDHVRAHVRPLGEHVVDLTEALGSITTAAVRAPVAVPPFDNSAVDGFAVSASDLGPGVRTLRLAGTVAAGDAGDVRVEPGTAVAITTGAPVPPGAAGVVMVEDAAVDVGRSTVTIEVHLVEGSHIRRSGEDLRVGDVAVDSDVELRPAHLGVLASVGCSTVRVGRRPVVAVASTGAELVEPGRELLPGRIPDANRPMLLAACRSAGYRTVDLGRVGDDVDEVGEVLRAGAATADVVLTSGGVSMGEFDPVKAVLASATAARWMQIAIKPAKPFAFGVVDGVPVLGLPGNPVSSAVAFELIVRPTLRYLSGGPFAGGPVVDAVAGDDFPRRRDGKVHYLRVRTERSPGGPPVVRSAGAQGSHQLGGLAAADGLAVVPDGDGLTAGDAVEVIVLDAPGVSGGR